jgi:hypothetical protein
MLEQIADRPDPAAIADQLELAVESAAHRLRGLDDVIIARRPAPGKWSTREILGHLLDSAANNHQRFVRAQQPEPLMLPPYAQDHWVGVQDYQGAPWSELVELWRLYNRHLARVMRRIPGERLGTVLRIGSNEPVTLGYLVEDYLVHLRHHLAQVYALLG